MNLNVGTLTDGKPLLSAIPSVGTVSINTTRLGTPSLIDHLSWHAYADLGEPMLILICHSPQFGWRTIHCITFPE
jgi:hypothetical protein